MDINDNADALVSSLMAELEYLDQKITKITDPAGGVPTQSGDPLDVKPPAAAKPVDAKGYHVLVRGDYYALATTGGSAKVKRPFETAFNLPKLEGALGVIRGRLLNKALTKIYLDFVSVRTCNIIKVTPLSKDTPEPTNLRYMPMERLLRYIEDHKVPVEPSLYKKDELALRASVIDFVQNPKGFAEREARRMEDIKADEALAKLNPDME